MEGLVLFDTSAPRAPSPAGCIGTGYKLTPFKQFVKLVQHEMWQLQAGPRRSLLPEVFWGLNCRYGEEMLREAAMRFLLLAAVLRLKLVSTWEII